MAWALVVFTALVLSLSLPVDSSLTAPSRVLLDRQGNLLRVWLDSAGQYRFPADGNYSNKYREAVLQFEDRHFMWHPGVNPFAIARAAWQNLRAGRVVSGASTLSMQVARLRQPRNRTWWAKLREAHRALRMEWQWGKRAVFAQYASLVPMGGNIVGVETASWRFFGHSAAEMTWAEATLLALLPNRPSALNLARSRERLLGRRNQLLFELFQAGHMDSLAYRTALHEPLPVLKPWNFRAPHYAEAVSRFTDQQRMVGSLDLSVQDPLERLAHLRAKALSRHSFLNMSVVVLETSTGKIRGYLGSLAYFDTLSQGMVDGVLARRSTGSTLKPFLYGLAISRGPYMPNTWILDVPSWYSGFSPQNADQTYSGLVSLKDALTRSLNVPAVNVLADYGLDEFHYWLQQSGLGGLFRSPEGYGLPLILGGAEASLAELTPLYSMLIQDGIKRPISWLETDSLGAGDSLLSPGAAYWVREMLTSVQRPDLDSYHSWFDQQVPVAWKTGTSYGARDAWAIGANSQWTIGVWVGNFRGGGVPGLSGGSTAAPLLFSLFNTLTNQTQPMWPPKPDPVFFRDRRVCAHSGYPAHASCPLQTVSVPAEQRLWESCPYHKNRVISAKTGYRVDSRCWDVNDTLHQSVETWPASVRAVWRDRGIEPPPEPVLDPACGFEAHHDFSWVYPRQGTRIYLPQTTENAEAGFIAHVAHRQKDVTLYWFMDGIPLGETTGEHKMAVRAATGTHTLVVQDARGQIQQSRFHVRRRENGT